MRALPEIFVTLLAPYLVYIWARPSSGETMAMVLSAMPPLLWSGYELVKTRRLDAIALTVAGSILLTVALTAMGGSARLIQIRDALVTGAVGIAFLLTMALPRPAIFYLARAAMARSAESAAAYETIWDRPGVPAVFRWLSLLWGFGLVGQTAAMCLLAWRWPIPRYLLLSPLLSMGIFGLLLLASLAYIARHPAAKAIVAVPVANRGSAGNRG